jgi:two-component system, sensor histidine kinase and response regulator
MTLPTDNNSENEIEPAIPVILVVDDIQTNIQVVGQILNENGYEVMPATSAAQAFERIKTQTPDLILLDFMMPEVNGLEVCRRLKSNPVTEKIPVIFLTASNEVEHVTQAFAAGAVDFVTKPFRGEELLARVRTHLELTKARQDLWQYGQRLRELNDEKNEFLGIVAHDLRSPLSNIITSASMALDDMSDPVQTRDFVDIIHTSAQHMLALVENLMDVNAIEQGKVKIDITPIELSEVIRGVVENYRRKAEAKEQQLVLTGDHESLIALTDPHATIQIFDNLISNAIKYSPPGKRVEVRLSQRDKNIRVEIKDQGPGLTPDDQKKLFGKFARLSARPTGGEPSTGLGLSIVKKMVEAAGGKVWCESHPGQGATFIVELKSAAVPEAASR